VRGGHFFVFDISSFYLLSLFFFSRLRRGSSLRYDLMKSFMFFFLDEKEPKNQENFKLACAPAGAARKIFGPTHDGSNRRLYWTQAFSVWGYFRLVAWFDALMVIEGAVDGDPQFGELEGCAVGIA
jgi:hypothetical protein